MQMETDGAISQSSNHKYRQMYNTINLKFLCGVVGDRRDVMGVFTDAHTNHSPSEFGLNCVVRPEQYKVCRVKAPKRKRKLAVQSDGTVNFLNLGFFKPHRLPLAAIFQNCRRFEDVAYSKQ